MVGTLIAPNQMVSYPCLAYLVSSSNENPDLLNFSFVSDFYSGEKLNPHNAFFVLNSHVRSTCSKYPIAAFKGEKIANTFASNYGGDVRNFDFALFVAKKDLEFDTPILEARKLREIARGNAIFTKTCNSRVAKCPPLNPADIKALHTFLENKSLVQPHAQKETIDVPTEAKCPVCGMFVHKYPKWTTQISLQNSHNYFFDGIKDMMKFYFEPSLYHCSHTPRDFTHIFVSDYYTLEKIEAKEAFFVTGANVYGPMGYELIPFKNEADAQEFSASHNGHHIYPFHKLTKKIIWSLE
ncbi:MAG: nitrous oxide reductase accessory protein NosL [Sulfuricurvum sp.]|nr:nitrous oxide reductase accessory protein NosL [Sulfuricurvum sp.]MDD5385823.1 nitrous oxide reductase accessory protein NosL [Sulfuricurvum sp.]